MADNPYKAPTNAPPQPHPLKSLVRIALFVTYPFLAISMLAFVGLCFGGAFVAQFTVENKTDRAIVVTPIGTVGEKGARYPLPVYMWPFPAIASVQRGGFEIPPGESIDIMYDMDDINFSEIVVHDRNGQRGQLVVNPNPTQNQYRAPAQKHFPIDDLDSLVDVPASVRNASRDAQIPTTAPWRLLGMLFAPWLAFALLSWLNRSLGKSDATRTPVVAETQKIR